jgi:hypothetical protein
MKTNRHPEGHEMTTRIDYGQPRPVLHYSHVVLQSVTINRHATYGHKLTCDGCGATDECHAGSSVSLQDAPGQFGYAHRNCAT